MRRLQLQCVFEAPEPRVGKKADAALAPFAELCEHILGNECDVGSAADLPELFGIRAWNHQSEVGCAVGRSDDHPLLPGMTRLLAPVKDYLEAEEIQVKLQASVQVSHVDHHRLKAQEGILALRRVAGVLG
jgi:hypothetical protein